MVVFSEIGFAKRDWHPTKLHLCKPGEWNVRMLVETVLSMLTYICNFKHIRHAVSVDTLKQWVKGLEHLRDTCIGQSLHLEC